MLYLTMTQTQGNRSTLQILFRRRVTRRCVLLRGLLTLVAVVSLLATVVTSSISRTVLLYGTTSLSVRGGLPIPIGRPPRRTIAAGGVQPSLLNALGTAASAASTSGTRSPTPTGRENVSLLRVRWSSIVDGSSHKEVGRVLVGITHGLRPWANLIFKRINIF